MICKKDVILWFKELESYKRIDMMCTLLNMCLPFELRFLGTCLEELGRRDSQELRGIELRVNNPQDLATDMMACQKGEPTDKKIRRKMALYLALIRACNRSCVAEIFRTLDGWGEREFHKMNDSDTLQELLLVYTMAANHPVFSFEQHMKCTEIFEKIKENKLVGDPQSSQLHTLSEQHIQSHFPHHPDIRQHMPPTQQDIMSQGHTLHAIHIAGQHHQMQTAPMPVMPQGSIPLNFPHTHLAKMMSSEGNIQHQLAVDSMSHMLSSNVAIPSDLAIAHPGTWAVRSNMHQYGPHGSSSIEPPPQSSSPMLSQQSSPSSSRATSPNRSSANVIMQQQQQQNVQSQQNSSHHQMRNMPQRVGVALKNVRRPSSETTPPPIGQTHQQMLSNEIILPQNMKHMDDVVINTDGSMHLQTLIRNGYSRNASHHRHKSGNFIQHHPQQQQQQMPLNQHFQAVSPGNFAVNTGLTYSMQNMSLLDGVGGSNSIDTSLIASQQRNKSGGSDSGSSIGSSGEISPPETPTLMSNNSAGAGIMRGVEQIQHSQQQQKPHLLNYNKQQQISLNRVNGRLEKIMPGNVASAGNSAGTAIIYAPSASATNPQQPSVQQQYIGADIILTPATGTSSGCMMQSTLASNNAVNTNTATITVPVVNAVSANNNIGNTVLISSPSTAGGCGLLSNVITSSVMQQQQQYNASYPYHAAAAQHLATTSRPPIISHNPGMGPSPPGPFRLPAFQIPPNGEILYPAYHPAGIAFLSGGGPPGATTVALRSSTSTSVNQPAANTTQGNTTTALQQQLSSAPNPVLLTAASPYTTLSAGVNKPISCYNCGSQSHNGRDCHEASMDDVTRSAIYKLDYSVSAAAAAAVNQTQQSVERTLASVSSNSIISGTGAIVENSSQHKQHVMVAIDTGITTTASTSSSSMTS